MLIKTGYPNHLQGCDFPCVNLMNYIDEFEKKLWVPEHTLNEWLDLRTPTHSWLPDYIVMHAFQEHVMHAHMHMN